MKSPERFFKEPMSLTKRDLHLLEFLNEMGPMRGLNLWPLPSGDKTAGRRNSKIQELASIGSEQMDSSRPLSWKEKSLLSNNTHRGLSS